MAGGFDIQSFFKSVSSTPPPAPELPGAPPQNFVNSNQGAPPPLPPGFGPPPHPGYMNAQHLQGPPPPGPLPFPMMAQRQQGVLPPQHPPPPFQNPSSGPPNSAAADLMALLRAGPPGPPESQFPPPPVGAAQALHPPSGIKTASPPESSAPTAPPLAFVPSSPPSAASKSSWFKGKAKKGTGRVLTGTHVVYDIDEQRGGEAQPQLEVHTISKVPLEYRLEFGREIAVNRNYICYGMKTGSVRILSQVEDAKVLVKEHTQRLSDLAVFAEDVNILASASPDGRLFLHEVIGRGKKDTKARAIVGLQLPPEGGPLRFAWNPRQQEHLAIVQGNSFYLAEVSRLQQQIPPPQEGEPAPLIPIDLLTPPPGLRLVGTHADVINDVTFSPAGDWIASASKDGLVKVWGSEGDQCLLELTPHSGEEVSSVRFVAAPGRADDVVMLTGGPKNREIKLWARGGEEAGGWKCVQTVELTSTSEEDAFFNHLHVDHRSGLVFLANTLRNSLYVLNLRHGGGSADPPAFDYLAEFSFTAPILSFTTLNEGVVDGEETVEIYTVQPEKIQRYALDASLCRPPPPEEPTPPAAPAATPGPLSPLLLSQLSEHHPPPAHKPLISEVPSAPSNEHPPPKEGSQSETEPSAPNAPEGLEVSAPKPPPGVSPDLTREFSRGEHGHVSLGVGSRGLVQNMNELKKHGSRGKPESPSHPQGPEVFNPLGVETALVDLGAKEAIDLKEGEDNLEQGVEAARKTAPLEDATEGVKSGVGKEGEAPKDTPKTELIEAPGSMEIARPSAGLLTPSMLMGGPKKEEPQPAAPPPQEDIGGKVRPGSAKQHVGSPPKAKAGNNVKWAPKGGAGPEIVSSAPAVDGMSYEDVMKGIAAKKEEPKTKKEPAKVVATPPPTAAVAALAVPPTEEGGVSSEGDKVEPEKKRKGKEKEKGPAQVEVEIAAKAETVEDVTTALQTGPPPQKESDAPSAEGLVDPAALTPGGFVLGGAAKGRKKNKGGNLVTPTPTPPPAEPAPGPSAPPPPPLGGTAPPAGFTEALQQILGSHSQVLKQIGGGVNTAVVKEGKRIETALGLRLEKVIKANAEANQARSEEDRVKREKAEKLRMDTALQAITGALSRDLPALVEKSVKKELAAAAPAMSKLLGPTIEKSVQEALVKGDGNKDLSQLEKTVGAKLEASLNRQVQVQFQTTLKAALQETLRTSFQSLLLPSFEAATRAMFEQIEGAVRGGMAEQAQNAQQGAEAANGALVGTLQETIASASALVATLQSEIAEGQRKLIALAEASGKQRTASLSKQGNGGLPDGAISLQHVEESLDPTKELSRLLGAGKYEEAFLKALNAFDVPMVSWLCNQVDPNVIFSSHPLPLSQGVLLSLVSQLGSDLSKDTTKKLDWISQAVLAINPEDPLLAPHMRPYLEQLYSSLHAQLQTVPSGGDVSRSLRTIIHVVNSLLTSCK